MKTIDIVGVWKDARYRRGLRLDGQVILPESPVGEVELTEEELAVVSGAGDDFRSGRRFRRFRRSGRRFRRSGRGWRWWGWGW